MTITEKLSHLTAINLEALFDEVLKENEQEICDMTREQMYEEGVMDVTNPGHIEKYAPSTIKAKKNAPYSKTDFITLKWFGDFHKSLKLIIFKEYFVVSSDDLTWANYLEEQSRFSKALGLTEKSKKELRILSLEELIKKIKSVI